MTQYRYKITHQDVSETGQPTTTLDNINSITTREGIESVIDTFEFVISQQNITPGLYLDAQDPVKIYLGSLTLPTDLVMDGIITDMNLNQSEKGKIWTVKGNNRFEYIMGYQRPTGGGNFTNTTAFSCASLLISQVNDANSAAKAAGRWVDIEWDSGNTGTSKAVNYIRPYKPVFQHLEELSKDAFTGLGDFYYYIDYNNHFIWKTKPVTVETGNTLTEGLDFKSDKVQKASYDAVNAAIINGGTDFNGRPIYKYVVNYNSVGKIGFKWKYYEDIKVAEAYKSNAGAGPTPDLPFGVAASYTGGNTQLRTDVRNYLEGRWQSKLDLLGLPRWRCDIEVRGGLSFTKGKLYNIISPTLGWNTPGKTLRLTEIQHTFNKGGWITRLHFEQDEVEAIADLE